MVTMLITPLSRSLGRPRLARNQRLPSLLGLTLGALLLLVLAACNNPPPPTTDVPLNQLSWCNKQTLVFQDTSRSPAALLADWAQVKQSLNFTTYLPQTLPKGSCLVSGEAIINDKVLGSTFGVSYLLPGAISLAFSETALGSQPTSVFQCSSSTATPPPGTPTPKATATGTPGAGAQNAASLLCLGSKAQTNIVFDSNETQKDLQALFASLQPNVDWLPKSTQLTPTTTPGPSPTAQA